MKHRILVVFALLEFAAALAPSSYSIVGGGAGGAEGGFGLLLQFTGCDAAGCSTNKSEAYYSFYDDSDVLQGAATKCDKIDSSLAGSKNLVGATTTHFFLAFTMTAGHKGKMKMSKECIGMGGTNGYGTGWPSLDTYELALITGTTEASGAQYTNQPFNGAAQTMTALRAVDKDVFIPYLMLATPFSADGAMAADSSQRRTSQWTYLDSSRSISLYFSERMLIPEGGGSVYLYEYKPSSTSAVPSTSPVIHTLTPVVVTDAPYYGTKVTMTLPAGAPRNRLYSLVIDAGALADAAGNAYGGINGQGTSGTGCTSLTLNPLQRDCAVKFVIPYTQSDVVVFPKDADGVNISQSVNTMLSFPEEVTRGTLKTNDAAGAVKFGTDVTGADVQILNTAGGTSITGKYYITNSGKKHIVEPQAALVKDAYANSKSLSRVNVSFAAGVFDYVDAVSYQFQTTPAQWYKAPEIVHFELYGEGKSAGDYHSTDALVWQDSTKSIVLYFDTRVVAADGKITLTPDSYPTTTPLTITAANGCYDQDTTTAATAAAQLAPCDFLSAATALVTLDGKTKVTITPGNLIPGEDYTLEIGAGAFGTSATAGKNAAWSTRFAVKQTLKECKVGAATGVAEGTVRAATSPVHRTTSIRLAFNGPVRWGDKAAISVGGLDQLVSDPDAVYHRNYDRAAAPLTDGTAKPIRYLVIVDPRQGANADSMLEDTDIKVTVAAGTIKNYAAPEAGICSFKTLKDDLVAPKVEGLSMAASKTSYGLANMGTATTMTLTFSEKVVYSAASSAPKITLTNGTTTYSFCAAATTTCTGTGTITGRSMTLSAPARLYPGGWTLKVPKGALVDTADATGSPANMLAEDFEQAFTVAGDITEPTCTVVSKTQLLHDGKIEQPADGTTKYRHTMVVSFSENVVVRDSSATLKLWGNNASGVTDTEILSLPLTGAATADGFGSLQFRSDSNGAEKNKMYVFAKFVAEYKYSDYFFSLSDRTAITDENNNPLAADSCLSTASKNQINTYQPKQGWPADRPTFAVKNAYGQSACGSSATSCVVSNSTQFLLEFSERVERVAATTVAASVVFQKKSTRNNHVGTDVDRETVDLTSADIILSDDNTRAYVEIPHFRSNQNAALEFASLEIKVDAFGDLQRSTANKTAVQTFHYNGTTDGKPDAVGPQVLMVLPGGGSAQALYNMALTANITLKMSEDVTVVDSTNTFVKLYACGQFATHAYATGDSSYPIDDPVCTSSTLLDSGVTIGATNGAKNNTVVVFPKVTLEYRTKYKLVVLAGAFKDAKGNANTEQTVAADGAASTWSDLPYFYTKNDAVAPAVVVYDLIQGPVTRTAGTDNTKATVLTLWFNQPITGQNAQVSNMLRSRYSNATGWIYCFDGGFKCTLSADANLQIDTTYTIEIPTVTDLDGNTYAGKTALAAPVQSFKTTTADLVDPAPLFCIVGGAQTPSTATDADGHRFSVVSPDFTLYVGFTEAIRLADGKSAATYLSSGSGPKICSSVGWSNDKCVSSLDATVIEGGSVLQLKPTAATDQPQSPAGTSTWDLGLPTNTLTDSSGRALSLAINGSFCRFQTVAATTPTLADTMPANGADDVHTNDFITLRFSETVVGAASATLTLKECGPLSVGSASSSDCDTAASTTTKAASALKFGNKNAIWQLAEPMKVGRKYHLTIPAGAFVNSAGKAAPAADTTKTWRVALSTSDYRGTNSTLGVNRTKTGDLIEWGAACIGEEVDGSVVCAHHLVANEIITGVDASKTLYFFFPTKLEEGSSKHNVYLNATSGTSISVKTYSVAADGTHMKVPLTGAVAGTQYSLSIYNLAWGTNILQDPDSYYWNSGSQTAKSGGYATGGAGLFSFQVAPAPHPYRVAPSFDASMIMAPMNATIDVSSTSMLAIYVKANVTDVVLGGSITLKSGARKDNTVLDGTDGTTKCASNGKWDDCCGAASTTETITFESDHKFVDRIGNITAVSGNADTGYVPIYFRPEAGLSPYSCYQVHVGGGVLTSGAESGAAYQPAHKGMWFTTSEVAKPDMVPPAPVEEKAFFISSKGSSEDTNVHVARSARLTVAFNEDIAILSNSQIELSINGGASVSGSNVATYLSVSGKVLTVAPPTASYEFSAGAEYTLSLKSGSIKDASGNALSKTLAYTFTTEYTDADAPVVLHKLPEAHETASVNARVVVFMSENVNGVSGSTVKFGSATEVDATQSTWPYEKGSADLDGVVFYGGSRVSATAYAKLSTSDTTQFTVAANAFTDVASNKGPSAQDTMDFTVSAIPAVFSEVANTATYGGDVDVAKPGAAAVACKGTMYLIGGALSGTKGSPAVCTSTDGAAWECKDSDAGAEAWNRVSAAADSFCNLWVVGGNGVKSGLLKSSDGGATFTQVVTTPLPTVKEDGTVTEGEPIPAPELLKGASLAIIGGWKVVICGGGLDRCIYSVTRDTGLGAGWKMGGAVPAGIKNRYFATMLADGDMVRVFGGEDAAEGATKCYQDAWEGNGDSFSIITAKLTPTTRCFSSYVQAGDGTIYVLGGKNAIKDGAFDNSVYESAWAVVDKATTVASAHGSIVYSNYYAEPYLSAYSPTGTSLSLGDNVVTLVFNEPVVGAAATTCITVKRAYIADGGADADATINCHVATGKCGTTCGGSDVAATVASTGATVTISLGSWVNAQDTVLVTLVAGVVADSMGNGNLVYPGWQTEFSFGYAAAAADFALLDGSQGPFPSGTATPNTNFIYQFNKPLDADTSSSFGLSIAPSSTAGKAFGISLTINQTHVQKCSANAAAGARVCEWLDAAPDVTIVGNILKVAMPSGVYLTPAIAYTHTLSANSVKALGSSSATSPGGNTAFTTISGLVPNQKGTVYKGGTLENVILDQNWTAGTPSCSVKTGASPTSGTTDVDGAEVHIVVQCDKAVKLNTTKTEEFALWYLNGSSWALEKEIPKAPHGDDGHTDIYYHTTDKTVTLHVTALTAGRTYKIVPPADSAEVIRDFREETYGMDGYGFSSVFASYTFSVPTATTASVPPSVVATSLSAIVLGNEENTTHSFVFSQPVKALNASALGFGTNLLKESEWSFNEDQVLTVALGPIGVASASVPCSTTTAADTYSIVLHQMAATDSNAASSWTSAHQAFPLTHSSGCVPTLTGSAPFGATPTDDAASYVYYGASSTVTLMFSETVQAGQGTVTIAGKHGATEQKIDSSSLTFVGKFAYAPTAQLVPGEVYTVSAENRTVRSGATGGYLNVPPDYTKKVFSTVPLIKMTDSGADEETVSAGVLVTGASKIFVIGGETSKGLSNKTRSIATWRDRDAKASAVPANPCQAPCGEATEEKTANTAVYRSASQRGFRRMNVANRVAHSNRGAAVGTQVVGVCACPVCIHGPPTGTEQLRKTGPADSFIPKNVKASGSATYAEIHKQTPATGTSFDLECDQGYSTDRKMACTVSEDPTDWTREYFGVWRVNGDAAETVCKPAKCGQKPAISNAKTVCGSDPAVVVTHGQSCDGGDLATECASGYELSETLKCNMGQFNSPSCNKKACSALSAPTNGKISGGTSGVFGDTRTLACNAGYEIPTGADTSYKCVLGGRRLQDEYETTAAPAAGTTAAPAAGTTAAPAAGTTAAPAAGTTAAPAATTAAPAATTAAPAATTAAPATPAPTPAPAAPAATGNVAWDKTPPAACKAVTCAKPADVANGKLVGCDGVSYGARRLAAHLKGCNVVCNDGYAVEVGGRRLAAHLKDFQALTCQADKTFTAAGKCTAVTCSAKAIAALDPNSDDGSCTADLGKGKKCTRRCKDGFRPGGDASLGNALDVECTVAGVKATGKLGQAKCAEMGCTGSPDPNLDADTSKCSKHGGICAAACKSGFTLAPEKTTHMKCVKGSFLTCTDATCATAGATGPVCVAAGGTTVQKEAVTFALEFAVADVAAVSKKLDENPADVAASFSKGACDIFDCAKNGLVVETKTIRVAGVVKYTRGQTSGGRRLAAHLKGAGGIEVEFEVVAEEGKEASLTAVTAQIEKIASDPAAAKAFQGPIATALKAATGIEVTGVKVTQAAKKVKVMVVVPPPAKKGGKKKGGGGGLGPIIGGVVGGLVVVGIAVFVWKKKSGASVSSA